MKSIQLSTFIRSCSSETITQIRKDVCKSLAQAMDFNRSYKANRYARVDSQLIESMDPLTHYFLKRMQVFNTSAGYKELWTAYFNQYTSLYEVSDHKYGVFLRMISKTVNGVSLEESFDQMVESFSQSKAANKVVELN